jgi:hypothetical protein
MAKAGQIPVRSARCAARRTGPRNARVYYAARIHRISSRMLGFLPVAKIAVR